MASANLLHLGATLLGCVGDGRGGVLLVVVVVVVVALVVVVLVPTQYAYPAHSPAEQSAETAGFHA